MTFPICAEYLHINYVTTILCFQIIFQIKKIMESLVLYNRMLLMEDSWKKMQL